MSAGLQGRPFDDDAERQALSQAMADPRAAELLVAQLGEDDFHRPAHRRIFGAIVALVAAGHATDPLAVRDALERRGELAGAGGVAYVTELIDASFSLRNQPTIVRLLHEKRRLRQGHALAEHYLASFGTAAAPAQDLFAELQTALLPLLQGDRRTDGFQPLDLLAVGEELERRQRGEGGGIPLGFAEFDRATNGLEPGELFLLGGAPKTGKSTLAGQIALQVALGGAGGVGYVSGEMSQRAITERLLSAYAGVPFAALRSGQLADEHWRRIATAMGILKRAPLWIDDGAAPRLEDISARVLALKAAHPDLTLVIVDFLQLVQLRLKGRRGDEELEAIAYGLTSIAKRAGVAIIAPTQLNQKSIEDRQDKRPLLRDLSGSAGPLKACDFCALLHRPALYEELAAGTQDRMLVLVEASRRTPTFHFALDWQSTVMRGIPAGQWVRPDEFLLPPARPVRA